MNQQYLYYPFNSVYYVRAITKLQINSQLKYNEELKTMNYNFMIFQHILITYSAFESVKKFNSNKNYRELNSNF